jgi:hypothetical protein
MHSWFIIKAFLVRRIAFNTDCHACSQLSASSFRVGELSGATNGLHRFARHGFHLASQVLHATESIGATWCDYTEQESSFIESAHQTGIFEEQGVPLPIGSWPPARRVWVCNADLTLYETTADTGNRREVRRLTRAM